MTIGPRPRLGSWSGAHSAWSSAVGLSLRGLPKANRRNIVKEERPIAEPDAPVAIETPAVAEDAA